MPWFFILGLGLLHAVYTITGFDASAHTSEETRNAPVEVPKGMIRSVFWSFLFGYFMVCAFVLALPDQTDASGKVVDGVSAGAAQGWASFNWMLASSPMPQFLRAILIVGIVASNFLCALAGLTSMSRMMYAFSRDGGLPASGFLRSISPTTRTPGPAIWVGGVLAVLATLYGDAFIVLSTGCAVFLYLSYLMPVAAAMVSEMGGNWKHKGPFNLGGASIPVALLAIIGCATLITVGVVPPQQKVGYLIVIGLLAMASLWASMESKRVLSLIFALLTAAIVWFFWGTIEGSENTNIYAAVVFGVMLVMSFILHGKRFAGPPIGDEIKRRAAEIAAEEARVGEKA
jgi:amino acid transporter